MKIFFLLFINISLLFSIEIFDVTDKTAKINVTNLKIGHSGIVVKNIENNTLILTQATIIKSDNESSTIEFIEKDILPQDAIPTTNIKPSYGDKFILNHLYTTSLLIVPNENAKKQLLHLFPNQNFLNEDFFASHLKLINAPLPTKDIIKDFAQSQEIGTIFIVANKTLYLLDSVTFKIINTIPLTYNETEPIVPFLTKITDIKTSLWSFGNEKIENYNEYYLELMEQK